LRESTTETYVDKHPYIVRDDRGVPVVNGTTIPVSHIVEYVDRLSYQPEKVAEVLSLKAEQVYDALSFYQENREEIDGQMEDNDLYYWYQWSRF